MFEKVDRRAYYEKNIVSEQHKVSRKLNGPCITSLLIGLREEQRPSTRAEINRLERKLDIKIQREGYNR